MSRSESEFEWEAWQVPYRHGTLALYPPPPVRRRINRWRKELDPVSHGYAEAHIILTQPFADRVTEDTGKLHGLGFFDLSLAHTEDFVPHMTITEGLSGPPVDDDLLRSTIPEECVASYDAEHHEITLRYLGRHIVRLVKLESLISDCWPS